MVMGMNGYTMLVLCKMPTSRNNLEKNIFSTKIMRQYLATIGGAFIHPLDLAHSIAAVKPK